MRLNNHYREEKTSHNTRLAQWGLTLLIETFCFYCKSVLVDNLVFQNPPLRQAWKRCDEIPSGFRHIARRLCRPKPFQGLRTSEGFAKCKTLRKASGRYVQCYQTTAERQSTKHLTITQSLEQFCSCADNPIFP